MLRHGFPSLSGRRSVAVARFLAWAHRFKVDGRLLILLCVADVAGILGGWYYYVQAGQFDLAHPVCGEGAGPHCTPFWSWPLVADSPNAVLVVLAALLLHRLAGWRHAVLDAAAFTLNVYVGLWTTALFLAYADAMGTFDGGVNTVLFVTHMGMPLQAVVLLQDMRKDSWRAAGVVLVGLALAAFVAVDYWGPHWHPAPQVDAASDDVVGWGGHALLQALSVALMAATFAAWLLLARPLRGRATARTP